MNADGHLTTSHVVLACADLKPSLTRMESVLRAVTGEPRAQQVLAWQAALAGRKLPPALQQVELALARAIYPSLSSNPAAASAAGGQTPSRLAHAVKPLALHVDKAYVPPTRI